ncbi:SDR family oxidoreductase [Paenibacillus frigoriresistens]|uniref:SDR family NAD(P)-dependent oxidoreductase n=1 Tax=Paenibacillus alginolyticus TaxID=59839 RepID=UPI001563617A|nr:SDR family oxidoreductase [Paenibacillus frigoriresistens]NRF90364.1 SDR family oxidoreductase [Paenibacillus frigoriresistens]
MKHDLSGKIALVTGGSRGLGRWICYALAESGASVAVNYANNESDAQETVRIIEEIGGKAFLVRGDITREEEVDHIVRKAADHFGGSIDILVNNATGPQPMYAIEDSTWDIYMDQLVFFVKAPLLLTKAVLPGMKKRGAGRIINIGSEVVQLGNPNFSSYVSAKSAMVGMTRSWANELGASGIRVNLIAPGFIPVERTEGLEESVFENYRKGVPLGYQGKPTNIADAVVFFASGASEFITGQCLSVNGGNTLGI